MTIRGRPSIVDCYYVEQIISETNKLRLSKKDVKRLQVLNRRLKEAAIQLDEYTATVTARLTCRETPIDSKAVARQGVKILDR